MGVSVLIKLSIGAIQSEFENITSIKEALSFENMMWEDGKIHIDFVNQSDQLAPAGLYSQAYFLYSKVGSVLVSIHLDE